VDDIDGAAWYSVVCTECVWHVVARTVCCVELWYLWHAVACCGVLKYAVQRCGMCGVQHDFAICCHGRHRNDIVHLRVCVRQITAPDAASGPRRARVNGTHINLPGRIDVADSRGSRRQRSATLRICILEQHLYLQPLKLSCCTLLELLLSLTPTHTNTYTCARSWRARGNPDFNDRTAVSHSAAIRKFDVSGPHQRFAAF